MSDNDVLLRKGGHGRPCPYKTLTFGFAKVRHDELMPALALLPPGRHLKYKKKAQICAFFLCFQSIVECIR